jgi:phage terminase large subunit-like protein
VQWKWTETANYWNFSKSKCHNSGKNGSIVPKTVLDLDILTINLYTKCHFNMFNQCKRKWTETANYWNFSKSKGQNSDKNGSIVPKTGLGLDIFTMNLYTKFHFNIRNQCKENDRKLQTIGIFRSPRNITGENGSIVPKTKLDLDILTINLYTRIHFNMFNQCKRKWTETANYWNFSKSKGHNSSKNGLIVPKTQLEIDILTMNLYTKFHFNMCNQCKENERKQQIIGIFRSPRVITQTKMARSYPKHKWT